MHSYNCRNRQSQLKRKQWSLSSPWPHSVSEPNVQPRSLSRLVSLHPLIGWHLRLRSTPQSPSKLATCFLWRRKLWHVRQMLRAFCKQSVSLESGNIKMMKVAILGFTKCDKWRLGLPWIEWALCKHFLPPLTASTWHSLLTAVWRPIEPQVAVTGVVHGVLACQLYSGQSDQP